MPAHIHCELLLPGAGRSDPGSATVRDSFLGPTWFIGCSPPLSPVIKLGHLGSENRGWGGIQWNSETTSTPAPRLKFNTLQDFESFQTHKNLERRRCRTLQKPPQKCHFPPSFRSCLGDFCKKIKKNALDIIRMLFEDKSIAIDIVPQLRFFSTFHGVSRLFANTKFA